MKAVDQRMWWRLPRVVLPLKMAASGPVIRATVGHDGGVAPQPLFGTAQVRPLIPSKKINANASS